jgi:hypothetical protein
MISGSGLRSSKVIFSVEAQKTRPGIAEAGF